MKKEIRPIALFFLFVPGLLFGFGCRSTSVSRPPEEVVLQLKWRHQAQFAGFYLARENGTYRRENLKVSFLEGGHEVDNGGNVATGKAHFGVLSPEDLLVRRAQGAKLKAVAAIFRRSAVVFVAKTESGIERPWDFLGRTVAARSFGAAREFHLQFLALMDRLGLDPGGIRLTDYDPAYSEFLKGTVQVTPCYSTSGLIRLRQRGLKLNLILPEDYGSHFYSDLLVTTEGMINEKPDLVVRFVRASLQGWREAVENYPEAVQVVLRYAREKDPELQTRMMEAQLPLVHTGEGPIGWMEEGIWEQMARVLKKQRLIDPAFNVAEAYTLQFLHQIYGKKRP